MLPPGISHFDPGEWPVPVSASTVVIQIIFCLFFVHSGHNMEKATLKRIFVEGHGEVMCVEQNKACSLLAGNEPLDHQHVLPQVLLKDLTDPFIAGRDRHHLGIYSLVLGGVREMASKSSALPTQDIAVLVGPFKDAPEDSSRPCSATAALRSSLPGKSSSGPLRSYQRAPAISSMVVPR